MSRAVLFALASDGTVSAHKATIEIIGEHTGGFAQCHFEYDAKQSGSTTISQLIAEQLAVHRLLDGWKPRATAHEPPGVQCLTRSDS